jgi:hypothetical protein
MPSSVRQLVKSDRLEDIKGLFEEEELFQGYVPMAPTPAEHFIDLSSPNLVDDPDNTAPLVSRGLSKNSTVSSFIILLIVRS